MSTSWIVGKLADNSAFFDRGSPVFVRPTDGLDSESVFYRGNPVCDISSTSATGYEFIGLTLETRNLYDMVAVLVMTDGEIRCTATRDAMATDKNADGMLARGGSLPDFAAVNSTALEGLLVTASARVLHKLLSS
ncbi:MAG: hypothetical protein VW491_01275 [Gammaproteobacteria bacterium]